MWWGRVWLEEEGRGGLLVHCTLVQCICSRLYFLFLFVCLFVVIKPGKFYLVSCLGLEVKPLGVYPVGPRSSSCGPTKGTPPPRNTLRLCVWLFVLCLFVCLFVCLFISIKPENPYLASYGGLFFFWFLWCRHTASPVITWGTVTGGLQ